MCVIEHSEKLFGILIGYFFSLELQASFPYRDVTIQVGCSPKDAYDISPEELGRYLHLNTIPQI